MTEPQRVFAGPWYLPGEAAAMLGVSVPELLARTAVEGGPTIFGAHHARMLFSHTDLEHSRNWHPAAPTLPVTHGTTPPLRMRRRSPVAPPKPQHLYLVEVADCCVKVGITIHPIERIATHARTASGYGREIGRVWVSVVHKEASANERRLVGSGSEYLRREFDDVLEQALALPFTRVGGSNG